MKINLEFLELQYIKMYMYDRNYDTLIYYRDALQAENKAESLCQLLLDTL